MWSDGRPPYPWVREPPPELQSTATLTDMVRTLKAAGVSGALVLQPANHGYDHRYVHEALLAEPQFLRGMCLANPTLPVQEAVADLEQLRERGFGAVRFNAASFPGGLDSPVGHSLFLKAEELAMPVGIMCFTGLTAHADAIEALLKSSPSTRVVIDHWGFPRQPATGGLLGDAATSNEAAWAALLALSKYPQVFVKLSSMFRVSALPWPHQDLKPRVRELLQAYGSGRLMWGSDWPWVTVGGGPWQWAGGQPDAWPTPMAVDYNAAVMTLARMEVPELGRQEMEDVMWRTAAKLFGFPATVGHNERPPWLGDHP